MAGVFGVTPLPSYPSWAQGLEQGTGALANAMYQRRLLDLERQKFGLQQAEAGYVPEHTEYQPKPGALSAPSYESMGNVPSPTPGVMQPGAPTQIFRGVPGQTATDQLPGSTPVKVPGHYDLTKSLAYQTSLARIMEMQQKGLAAAQVNAGARVQVAGMNDATRTGIANNLNGYIGTDGQIHYGMRTLGAEALSGFNNGQWTTDSTGQSVFQPGVATQGKIAAAAPSVDERRAAFTAALAQRQAAQGDLDAHRRATENAAAIRAAQQAVDTDTRGMPKPPPFGFLNPADSVAFFNQRAASQARLTTDRARLDSLSNAPSGPVTTPGARPLSSGSSVAPHVPRSGTEASSLTPIRRPLGSVAPTVPLGTRRVPDTSTASYPKATNLPRSPGDPTVPVSQSTGVDSERALYDAAVRRIAQNVSDPAEQARQFQRAASIYQQRVARQKAPQ